MTKAVEVFVDGKRIARGRFGGEPEDNYEFRDYAWVIPLIATVASKLGGKVVHSGRIDE